MPHLRVMMPNHCAVKEVCLNSARCDECVGQYGVEDALEMDLPLLFQPRDGSCPRHPIHAARTEAQRVARLAETRRKQSQSVMHKRKLQSNAVRNERDTRNVIIQATKRSGAAFGDGDSRLYGGSWGIDDKLLSKATKTVSVPVAAIDKARAQNCVIVVTLGNGSKYAVANLDDFISCAAEIAALKDSK